LINDPSGRARFSALSSKIPAPAKAGVSTLIIFAAAFARLTPPALWLLRPNVVAINTADGCAIAASGALV